MTHLKKLSISLNYCIVFGILFSLIAMFFSVSIGTRIFYLTSYIALFSLFLNYKKIFKNKSLSLLALGMLILGLSHLIWVQLYKLPNSEYAPVYRAYHESGKALIACAILTLSLSFVKKTRLNFLSTGIFLLCGFILFFSLYQKYFLNLSRVELNFGHATTTAYCISIVSIIGLQRIIYRGNNISFLYFFVAFSLLFVPLILTGTRAAILIFPLIALLLLFLSVPKVKENLKYILSGILLIFGLTTVLFGNQISNRMNELNEDLRHYESNNSVTSIGARIAMFTTGFYAGNQAWMGESAEQRASIIQKIILENPKYQGAGEFLNTHLHNEWIDNYSLKGIWGILSLVIVYSALFYSAIKQPVNPLLLCMVLFTLLFGLSDMIFYAKETTITYLCAFCLAIVLSHSTCLDKDR